MSVLPQRKKTPEEINRLRDQLGIRAEPETRRDPAPATPAQDPVTPATPGSHATPQSVRSLKRAERDASRGRTPNHASPYSKLPARRHSDEELQDIRRREALSRFDVQGGPSFLPKAAPVWLLVPAYLLAGAGWACHRWPEIPLEATAGAGAGAFTAAALIGLARPLSRHHAGFISILTLLALVFAILHYFPHLRHAS